MIIIIEMSRVSYFSYIYRALDKLFFIFKRVLYLSIFIPRYEVYRGYIVFAFSVTMFVCLSVCNFFFFVKDFSATTWVRILKFGTKLDGDELYGVTKKKQPHIAYQSATT